MSALFIELGRVFIEAVNITITAGWLVLVVLLLRLFLKKAPKWAACLLWGVVALRLLLPFSFESVLSLIPSSETLPVESVYSTDPGISDNPYYQKMDSGVEVIDRVVTPILRDTTPSAMRSGYSVLACLWLVGVLGMLVYTAVSYLRLSHRTREGVLLEGRVYLCDRIDTPFILGVVRPRVFLPSAMAEGDRVYVLAHERAHLRRGDHLWKPLGFALLSVYWFNPLMWVAYILLCRDIELACDEKVIRELGETGKVAYSEAIINCAAPRRLVSACPLAFGEVGVKGRIKAVLHYKKPAFWVIVTASLAGLVLAVCFLTDPPQKGTWLSDQNGLFINTVSAECDNVAYTVIDASAQPKDSYLQVEWENNTSDVLCFGQEFFLYKDGEPYPMEDAYWELLLYTVMPRGNYIERYNLPGLPHGEYRLEKQFYLEKDPDTKYRAFVSFTVDTTYSFINTTYRLDSVVYATAGKRLPFDTNDKNARIFSVSSHKLLSVAERGGEWQTLGELLPLVPERKNFDDLFADTNWQGGLLAPKLRKDNLHMMTVNAPSHGRFAYLLEQKNGDIYLAYGHTDTNKIYWVFKLYGVYQGYLSNRYPDMLDLPTTKGLEVYVSKFSPDGGYRCTLKAGRNLGYTQEELMNSDYADIRDMAKILATYEVSPENITVIPYPNPLSSFLWTDPQEDMPLIKALLGVPGWQAEVKELEDKAETQNLMTDEALELFYEDAAYEYYFPSIRSEYVVVRLYNGEEIPVSAALREGLITVEDLNAYEIYYIKRAKVARNEPPSLTLVGREKYMPWMGGYDWTYQPLTEEAGHHMVADAPSPLQAVEQGAVQPCTVYVAEGETRPVLNMYFALEPDRVRVLCYRFDGTVWQQTKTHVLGMDNRSIQLIDGDEFLYVIEAEWQEKATEEYYGTVTYLLRPVLRPQESTTTTPTMTDYVTSSTNHSTAPMKKD